MSAAMRLRLCIDRFPLPVGRSSRAAGTISRRPRSRVGHTLFDPSPVLLGVSPSEKLFLSQGRRVREARGCDADQGRFHGFIAGPRTAFVDVTIGASAKSAMEPPRPLWGHSGEESGVSASGAGSGHA